MAQKKAGEVEAFLSRPDTSFPVVLLYGPDPGLVSERAAVVARLSGADLADPFSTVTLNADELERDIGRLFDEARTLSLFGGRRLIRVRGAGNGKNLADAVADLAADPPAGATIVIEAGDPGAAILRAAAAEGCDLIVTGIARDELLGRFRLGSTVNRLLRGSRVPLLVVKDRARRPYAQIVVATDLSEPSGHALQAAARLFPEQRLTVFHAYDAPRSTSTRDSFKPLRH